MNCLCSFSPFALEGIQLRPTNRLHLYDLQLFAHPRNSKTKKDRGKPHFAMTFSLPLFSKKCSISSPRMKNLQNTALPKRAPRVCFNSGGIEVEFTLYDILWRRVRYKDKYLTWIELSLIHGPGQLSEEQQHFKSRSPQAVNSYS